MSFVLIHCWEPSLPFSKDLLRALEFPLDALSDPVVPDLDLNIKRQRAGHEPAGERKWVGQHVLALGILHRMEVESPENARHIDEERVHSEMPPWTDAPAETERDLKVLQAWIGHS